VQDPLASWAAIAAAGVTLVVAILTLINTLIAKDSLKLMQQKERRWQPDWEMYLIDAYARRDRERGLRVYAANVRICNRSDADNSIKDINLRVLFNRASADSSNISIPLQSDDISAQSALTGLQPDSVLRTPLYLKGHGVVSGWAIFGLHDDILRDADIQVYELKIVDTYNTEASLEILVMQEQA
jgi:hypothetical protein